MEFVFLDKKMGWLWIGEVVEIGMVRFTWKLSRPGHESMEIETGDDLSFIGSELAYHSPGRFKFLGSLD